MKGMILVVDDEANQRDLVAGFLRKKGHDIQTADERGKGGRAFRGGRRLTWS